jgi:hypothetical protein
MFMHSSVLGCQVQSIILLRDLKLFRFEDALDLLTSLRVDILCMIFDFSGRFDCMGIMMCHCIWADLKVATFIDFV